jgi:hypothetical protein
MRGRASAALSRPDSRSVRLSASRLWRANGFGAAAEPELHDWRVPSTPTMGARACRPLRQYRHPLPPANQQQTPPPVFRFQQAITPRPDG